MATEPLNPFYQSLLEFTTIDRRLIPMLLETVNDTKGSKECISWLSEIDKAISIHKQISPVYYPFPNWAEFKRTRKLLPSLDTYERYTLPLQFLGYARDGLRNMFEKCGPFMRLSSTYLDHTYDLQIKDAIANIPFFCNLLNLQFEMYRTGTSILPYLESRPPPVNLSTDKFWGGRRRYRKRRTIKHKRKHKRT
jgi:hypothetical protein